MTKIVVQHFVENLLKVLKVLKTRTALTRNGLAEFRIRYTRQGAKAPFKPKKQLTCDKIYGKIHNRKRNKPPTT